MGATSVSAPGKVLLAGGYLVLDRKYTGLVFGLSARIHTTVKSNRNGLAVLVARSPQFENAVWQYKYIHDLGSDSGVILQQEQVEANGRNKFVETTVAFVLSYISSISERKHTSLGSYDITIIADSDYYSQQSTSSPCAGNAASPFVNFNVSISQAHKTGLGSSAALVTSITGALLEDFWQSENGRTTRPHDEHARLAIIHNLAQVAHCTAQGKVGSGFDVAAAVYGSCTYRRFSPSILEHGMEPGHAGFEAWLRDLIEDKHHVWDTEIRKDLGHLDKSYRIAMCDVDCGSETPSMVRKINAWRTANKDRADKLWDSLHAHNVRLAAQLAVLNVDAAIRGAETTIASIRDCLRTMTKEADVPVEPAIQTSLLDHLSSIDGVLGGVVPGAGGFDAVALLLRNDEATVEALKQGIERFVAQSHERTKDEKSFVGNIRMLDVKQEEHGIKVEKVSMYTGWLVEE